MEHADVIKTLTDSLRDIPEVRALFLSGSHGTGHDDAYSDIDFVLVATDGPTDTIAAHWKTALEHTGEIALWWDRVTRPMLINAITSDWTRTDVVILKPDQLRFHTKDQLKPLFDHDGLYDALPPVKSAPAPDPKRIRYQIEEFIRILGLLPLAVGREEYLNGVLGIFHLRNTLVELMISETGEVHRGGLLHLNRLITPDQKAELEALPPPVPERQAMIDGHMAYAKAYLPRARRLAEQWSVDWPERFEDVTWSHLHTTLGVKRPY
jgi:hypothetical protein